MRLRFTCPQCGSAGGLDPAERSTVVHCSSCSYVGLLPVDWVERGRVRYCALCGCESLYRQRDLNQKWAIVILLLGVAVAKFTKFVSIGLAGIVVFLLYRNSPEVLTCYRCRAQVRGHIPDPAHGRFDRKEEQAVRSAAEKDQRNSRSGLR